MFKKITAGLTAFLLALPAALAPIHALEPAEVPMDGYFHLVDFESREVLEGAYESFQQAKNEYNNIKESYVNLGIVKDGQTYEAEYALALFHVNDACDFEVEYTNTSDGTTGTINGCYGDDAAYLYTDDSGKYVTFASSGVTAQAKVSDVTVVPLQNIFVNLSMFTIRDGDLYHMIKGEMDDDYFAYIIDLGPKPEYLEEGKAYYSYDGHYFYSDDKLYEMLDDYRNGIRDSSVNPEDPWYDWYQFVSHRTLSHVTEEMLRQYFEETMGVSGPMTTYYDNDKDGIGDILNQSQLYGMQNIFMQAQYEFGANALMMLAVSQSESGSGRSSLSYTRNNLFSHAAYDNNEEAERGRYNDIRSSVISHAKYYLSGSYLSPMKEQYNGGFFGNLAAGMNVRYSSDPYWGEKMASAYRNLDETMGTGDGDSVQIGIRTVENEAIVYREPNTSSPIYTTGEMPDMAFVILDEIENDDGTWYEIQSDATLDEDGSVDLSYYYSWKNDRAYIKADAVQLLIGKRQETPEYAEVKFQAGDGAFAGGEETVHYELPVGSDAVISEPRGKDISFSGFDMDLQNVEEDIEYTAQYRNVVSMEFASLPRTEYELNDRIDLRNGQVLVRYEDGTEAVRQLTTSNVSGYDMSVAGDQDVLVESDGKQESFTISVSEEKDVQRAKIKDKILGMIGYYAGRTQYTDDQVSQILEVKKEMDATVQPYLTQPDLRAFDTILRGAYRDKINYVVADNPYGLAVSGLSVSIPLEEGQLERSEADEDTYRISIEKGISKDAEEAMTKYADYLGQTVLESFTISLAKNMEVTPMKGPLLCTVTRPANSAGGDVFLVLNYTENGDVVQCYTRQTTNTISFMTEGTGEFLLMRMSTSNQYMGEDPVETLTQESNSADIRGIIANAALGALLLVVIVFTAMYFLGKRRRKKHTERHEVKKEQYKIDSQNLEVTQALEILNTEMIRLDEIKKAESEQNGESGDDQHDGQSGSD